MEKKKTEMAGTIRRLNEKTLALLFDYQRFENDPRLEAMIGETENEYGAELSDDARAQVSAAGEARPGKRRGDAEDGAV